MIQQASASSFPHVVISTACHWPYVITPHPVQLVAQSLNLWSCDIGDGPNLGKTVKIYHGVGSTVVYRSPQTFISHSQQAQFRLLCYTGQMASCWIIEYSCGILYRQSQPIFVRRSPWAFPLSRKIYLRISLLLLGLSWATSITIRDNMSMSLFDLLSVTNE